jgi:hypothetical protein
MSIAGIQAALDTQLQTLSGLDPTQVAWPTVPFTPTVGVPYLAPEMSSLVRTVVGAGVKGVIKWTGTYTVNVIDAIGRGTADVSARADAILALFKKGTALSTSDGLTVICDVPSPLPLIQDGAWARIPVTVHFFAYESP